MSEKPILFSGDMVRAIREGLKTQTRRPINPQPKPYKGGVHPEHVANHLSPYIDAYCSGRPTPENPRGMSDYWCWWTEDDREGPGIGKCPFGQPGDQLWVRETWATIYEYEPGVISVLRDSNDAYADKCRRVLYRATDIVPHNAAMKWKPSIHMPRWASRITLEITDIRAERLKEISGHKALCEGIDNDSNPKLGKRFEDMQRMAFQEVWDSIYAEKGFGWSRDPWVWVVEFKLVEALKKSRKS